MNTNERDALVAQLRSELSHDKGWDYTEYERGRIAEKERCISLLEALAALAEGDGAVACGKCGVRQPLQHSPDCGRQAATAVVPEGLHPRTADLVQRFASALAEKLAAAERKYGYSDGWADPEWMDECRAKLVEHVAKGDPRDVAAYCAFLWHHGERTAATPAAPKGGVVVARKLAEQVLDALGRFVSDESWRNVDMETADAFSAALATGEQP